MAGHKPTTKQGHPAACASLPAPLPQPTKPQQTGPSRVAYIAVHLILAVECRPLTNSVRQIRSTGGTNRYNGDSGPVYQVLYNGVLSQNQQHANLLFQS